MRYSGTIAINLLLNKYNGKITMSTTLIILLILNALSIFLIMGVINSLMNIEKRIRNDILELQQKLGQVSQKVDAETIVEKTKEVVHIEPEISPEHKISQLKLDKDQRILRDKEAQDAQRRFENEWYEGL